MKKPSRPLLILASSLVSLVLSLHFGLTAHTVDQGYGLHVTSITDWGRVALTLVFGAVGCLGLASMLRKP